MTANTINYTVDHNHKITGFPHHDGNLFALHVGDNEMRVYIKATSGESFCILAKNVSDFTVEGLWNGAIVSDIFLWNLKDVPISSFGEGFALGTLYGSRMNQAHIEIVIAKHLSRAPACRLLELECSYGGNLACICDSVHISQIPYLGDMA